MTVLAIDQGTSSTKGVLVADDGSVVGRASVPIGCAYPHPGWVEQDAEEIWQSVLTVIDFLGTADAIAISNQRESAVVWSDAYVSPVIGWQDARTAPDCDRLREHEPFIRARTGLALDVPATCEGRGRTAAEAHRRGTDHAAVERRFGLDRRLRQG